MGGAGSAVNESLHIHKDSTQVLNLGLPDNFINHGDTTMLLAQCGLDVNGIINSINNYLEKNN